MSRRSQSYTDFHAAARAALGEGTASGRDSKQSKNEEDTKTQIDFVDWYYELEPSLLNASQGEYLLAYFPRFNCCRPVSLILAI